MTQKADALTLLTTFALTREELADHLMITENHASVLIATLKNEGHTIISEPLPTDKRGSRWRLEDRDE